MVQSTTVDSRPTCDWSALRRQPMRPSRSALTARQVVELGRPEILADGATTGTLQARRNCWAIVCFGILTAIVFRPAVASAGTDSDFGRTSVSGPGKNRSI